MSGGHFNYEDQDLLREMFGWTDEPSNVLEDMELSQLTWDLLQVIHSFDYYISGDTSKEQYLKDKTAFKNKWLSNRGVRVKRIIDESIEDLKTELYETYGVRGKKDET